MKNVIHFLVFCYIGTYTLTAQVPEVDWIYTFGGIGKDIIRASALTPQGDIVQTGFYENTVDFDQGPNMTSRAAGTGLTEMFIQKIDVSGNFIWVKTFPGTENSLGHKLCIGNDGAIYISGQFSSDSLDVDPDPSQTYFLKRGTYSSAMFLLKLDGNGNLEWAIAQSGANVLHESLKLDHWGNLYTTGIFYDSFDQNPDPAIHDPIGILGNNTNDFFIQKIDSSGNQTWLKTIRGIGDVAANTIDFSATHKLIISGYFKNSVDFDPGSGQVNETAAANKGFILVLDSAGNYEQVYVTEGAGEVRYVDMVIDGQDNMYMAGSYIGYADVDPGSGVSNPRNSNAEGWFIQKIDSNGNQDWAHFYENNMSLLDDPHFQLKLDNHKNVITIGAFRPTGISLEPLKANGVSFMHSGSGGANLFIAKHDAGGSLLWGHGTAASHCHSYTLLLNNTGHLYFSGFYAGSIDFDPYNTNPRTSNGGIDAFIVKLKPCFSTTDTVISITACNFYKTPSGQRFYSDTLLVDTLASVLRCDSVVKRDIQIIQLASIYEGLGSLHWNISTTDSVTFRWLDCNTQTLIPGQTGPDLMVTQNGSYALIVSDGNCTDTSACLTIDNVGLGELNNTEAISVYPNPVDDILWISGSEDKVYNLTLYNMIGRKLISVREQNHMNVSSLPAGTYFLQIETEGRSVVKKIVHR